MENIIKHNNNPEKHKASAAKGGKVKSICKALNRRKWCNGKCPIYPCFAEPISHGVQFKDKKSGRSLCALRQMPVKLQKMVTDFYTRGEEGFNTQIIERLTELGVKSASLNDSKEMRSFLRDVIEAKKSLFGDKQRIEAEVSAVTDADFRSAYRELQEIKKKEKPKL